MRSVAVVAASVAPMFSLAVWSGLPGQADSRHFSLAELPPLPAVETSVESSGAEQSTTLWYQLTRRTALSQLAASLDVDVQSLAALNDQPMNHVFESGTWFAVSSDRRSVASMLVSVASDSARSAPPVIAPPPVASTAKVQSGDSLASFLARHGIKEIELKRLNPGLAVADISVGRELRVAKAAGGQNFLAIRPITSGGASWPSQPTLRDPKARPGVIGPGVDQYLWPTKGVFTSGFGWRWGRMHKGIDIANNTGTSIHAAKAGIVTYAGWSGAYGYLVEIAHGDGESTRYAHNSRLMVSRGQVVPQGARISLMGSTGRSTGPHLHFEIRRPGGAAVNPLIKLPQRHA
ncbi:MAG: LysM peptidoglycan-binding domain-containing M23 family metallopeptidase [Cyanobacteriota bacterium]|nr:LysM peptidoglycan-binding domain-containing M23 family metallopeptidase [Cyanobacteriota bacterium]